jgi:hypothetical protein
LDDTRTMFELRGTRLARLASLLPTHRRAHAPARPARSDSARRFGFRRSGQMAVEQLEGRALLTTYGVGPGQSYADLGSVPWTSLGPGDVVAIHWRAEPYREKIMISASGTASAPIEIVGIPGPNGQQPVIDGQNATTSSQFHYPAPSLPGSTLALIARSPDQPYDYKPRYITIQGLEFRNAYMDNTYTDSDGTVHNYNAFAAAVWIGAADHVTISHCTLDSSGLGLFALSNGDEAHTTRDLLVEGNSIYGNGVPGNYLEHNVYTEALGVTFAYNNFGPLRPGSTGNDVKDRSAGAVFAYNTFAPGGHMLDLVDPEDDAPILMADPRFATTYVYGNVFNNTGEGAASSLIHLGGDSGDYSIYRPHLEFYNNTVINVGDQMGDDGRWRTIVFQMDSNDQSASVFNNIFFNTPATAGSAPSLLEFLDFSGTIDFGTNWVSPDWLPSHDNGVDEFDGTLNGTENLIVDPYNDPRFVDPAAGDFHLAAGSSAIGMGIAVPATDPAVDSEYVAPQSGAPRATTADLGAFPFEASPPAVLQVTATTPAPGSTGINPASPLTAAFNEAIDPSTLSFTLTGPDGQTVPALVVYNDTRHTATLLPSTALQTGTTYTAILSGAQDRAGAPLAAPVSWSFTTDTAPVVTGVSPTAAVGMYDGVSVTFDVPIDPASLALTYVGPDGWTIASTPRYDPATRTALFSPATGLGPGKTYTAMLSASAADLQGTAIAAPYTWSFTVSPVFDGSDRTTQGNWKGSYGTEGFDLPGDPSPNNPALPAYVASVTPTGASVSDFAPGTDDPRALRQAAVASAARTAGYWSSATSLSLHVAMADSSMHTIALYAVDFDNQGRSEQVDLIDDVTGQVLDTRTLTNFQNGTYLTWSVAGSVTLRVTNLSGSADAVVSGLFFGSGSPPPPATASFVGLDSTGPAVPSITYGADGFVLAGNPRPDSTALPDYVAAVTPVGADSFVWSNSVSAASLSLAAAPSAAPAAAPGLTGGFGTAWTAPTGFSINLEMNDTDVHRVVLYAVDFDNQNRLERIDLLDELTGQLLDTRTLSDFQDGNSLSWDVSGSVTIQVTSLVPSQSAIINGIFFGLPRPATASLEQSDEVTHGRWKGTYGTQGYALAGDASTANPSLPAYVASVSLTGDSTHVYQSSTSDPRALQQAADGAASRIAAVWYAAPSFTINVNMADTAVHQVTLYAMDEDSNRAEQIDVIDPATGQVLDTRQLSNFSSGVYLAWNVSGSVTFKVTCTAGYNAVISGLFFDPVSASAAFVKTDTTTQGAWKGAYGSSGYDIAGDTTANNPSLPAYVSSVALAGDSTYIYQSSTSDPRALQQAGDGATSRIAAVWYAAPSFTITVNMADMAVHQVALYAMDEDRNRSEQIEVINPANGQVLDTRQLTDFASGVYLAWNVSGSVTIKITSTAGSNAVINGLFFDPFTPATAAFVQADTTTQGTWKGTYGASGYDIAEDPSANNPSLPPYVASVSLTGASTYTYESATADPRALQQSAAGATRRTAAVWYAAPSFTITVNMADLAVHQVALYAMDEDSNRSEQIDVIDAATGQVLDTEQLTDFAGGVYLVWNVSGSVTFKVTCTAGYNAVINGLFFDPVAATAAFVKTDTTTQGAWKGAYGSSGYDIAGDTTANNSSLPAYVSSVSLAGDSTYIYQSSTSDPRALQQADAGATSRVAAVWYAAPSFTITVNMADLAVHQVALYAMDEDSNRSEQIDVIDPLTGRVLDTRQLTDFASGVYLAWNVSSSVTFRITSTAGYNAVINGLFLD